MSDHQSTLYHATNGKSTITCSCGKFSATVGRDFGKHKARDSHLIHAYKLHVEESK
jgi:hypothetical protein